jgi:hypothetical protein
MDPVIEVLEERGLVFPDRLHDDIVHARPFGEVKKIAENLESAISARRQDPKHQALCGDPFSFFASATLRGDIGCSECRWSKLDNLARYALLYSSHVAVPIKVQSECEAGRESHMRRAIANRIEEILIFRPAIEAGIISLVPSDFEWCEKHLPMHLPEYEAVRVVKQQLYEENLPKFSVLILPRADDSICIEITGPDDFLEHGFLGTRYSTPPSWLPSRYLADGGRSEVILSPDEVRASGLVDGLFLRIARDVFVHRTYGSRFDATYLTDLEGEAKLLQKTGAESAAVETAKACETLTHSIPMFAGLPLHEIAQLRKEEPDAFIRYRNALGGIVRDHVQNPKGMTEKDAKGLYADWLKPELDGLEVAAHGAWKTGAARLAQKVAVTAAVVALGVYTNVLSAEVATVLKALGLTYLVSTADAAIAESRAASATVKKHSLYFLLRAKRRQASGEGSGRVG